VKIDIAQLNFIDRTLRDILVFIEKETGLEPVITSLYRENSPGVHGSMPLRGTDIRVRNYAIGEEIEGLVNGKWLYDHSRPSKTCAILHGIGSNLHLHLQVHPNTAVR
jgi:hypothetical protein